ncbi:hypothetical protein NHQ30_006876 [Ciborinia camelliae]|nr:hypothetical protein NHQ30_006876 [Ciborinia camelliae]
MENQTTSQAFRAVGKLDLTLTEIREALPNFKETVQRSHLIVNQQAQLIESVLETKKMAQTLAERCGRTLLEIKELLKPHEARLVNLKEVEMEMVAQRDLLVNLEMAMMERLKDLSEKEKSGPRI